MKKYYFFKSVFFSIILLWNITNGFSNNNTITMYLQIGTLSELVLPEPYTTVQIPVQIIEMRNVPGRNNTVITVHPIIQERTNTNIRIYTQHYDFNIRVFINWPGKTPTESLDLGSLLKGRSPQKSSQRMATKSGLINPDIKRPENPEVKFFRDLVKAKPDLLKPNRHAHATIQNRVVFGIDYVFHFEDKLVFKGTLWNKSKVPYNILHMTITYKEKTGIPLLNQHQSKAMTLIPVFEKYTKKEVPPGQKSHIIYVTNKLSPKDNGFFNCVLVEKKGVRNFDFNIPSYIKH